MSPRRDDTWDSPGRALVRGKATFTTMPCRRRGRYVALPAWATRTPRGSTYPDAWAARLFRVLPFFDWCEAVSVVEGWGRHRVGNVEQELAQVPHRRRARFEHATSRRPRTHAEKSRLARLWVSADPRRSNRHLAKLARVSDHTIAKARIELEQQGLIPVFAYLIDERGEQQPV